jgi:hypothetical protein
MVISPQGAQVPDCQGPRATASVHQKFWHCDWWKTLTETDGLLQMLAILQLCTDTVPFTFV